MIWVVSQQRRTGQGWERLGKVGQGRDGAGLSRVELGRFGQGTGGATGLDSEDERCAG